MGKLAQHAWPVFPIWRRAGTSFVILCQTCDNLCYHSAFMPDLWQNYVHQLEAKLLVNLQIFPAMMIGEKMAQLAWSVFPVWRTGGANIMILSQICDNFYLYSASFQVCGKKNFVGKLEAKLVRFLIKSASAKIYVYQ
jgi:hypothetical protein